MRKTLLIGVVISLAGCSEPSSQSVDAAITSGDAVETPIDAAIDAALPQGNACATSVVEVARIVGANPFPSTVGPAYYSTATGEFYAVDVDGDNDRDLLVWEYNRAETTTYVYWLRVWPREGTGFGGERRSEIRIPRYGAELDRIGDVDHDGDQDLVITYTTEFPRTPYLYIALQDTTGAFALQSSARDMSPCGTSDDQRHMASAVFDVDRDGALDAVNTVSFGGLGAAPAGLAIARGGAGGLGTAQCVASSTIAMPGYPNALGAAWSFRIGDYDGDGYADIVSRAYSNNKLQWYRSTAASSFALVGATGPAAPGRLFVDHIRGRARDGLLAVEAKSMQTIINRVPVDASGVGTAAPVATLPVGYSPSSGEVLYGFAIGDFNADALTDVLVIGNQEFAPAGPTPFHVACDRAIRWDTATGMFPTGMRIVRAIDFDGDQRDEIVGKLGQDLVVFKFQ